MLALALPAADLRETCGRSPGWVCEEVFTRTHGNEALARAADFLVARPLKIVLILAGAYVASRLARRLVRRLVGRIAAGPQRARAEQRAGIIGAVLRSLTGMTITALAAMVVLGELGVNLGPLIAGAGIVGVAVGFGAQSLVRDFLSGMFILIEDQYGVGDMVDVGEARGVVEAMSLRTTRLRDGEGVVWHVPNGEIRRVGNRSQSRDGSPPPGAVRS